MPKLRRKRILHIVGSMVPHGLETWLMQVWHHIDRKQFEFHFCCLSGNPGPYAGEIESLGGTVIPLNRTTNLYRFNQQFRSLIQEGNYDVVHSHVHYFSGYILRLSAQAGLPARIAHSYSAPSKSDETRAYRFYGQLMRKWIDRYATLGIGNSNASMRSLFGPNWQTDERWKMMYCGIDLAPFQHLPPKAEMRTRLGIPNSAKILGHIGRLYPVKNHRFLIDIMSEVARQSDDVWLVIVGGGPLLKQLQVYAAQRGVKRIIFTGSVPEVYTYLSMLDAVVFPSLWEGLPQAILEAQAAGVPCLCSDTITPEVVVIHNAVHFLPLAHGARTWADTCLQLLSEQKIDTGNALIRMENSPFAIQRSVPDLVNLYRGE